MNHARLSAVLCRDEGVRLKPYRDSLGILTVGVGRNLRDKGISLHELSQFAVDGLPFPSYSALLDFLANHVEVDDGYLLLDVKTFDMLFPAGLSQAQVGLLLDADIQSATVMAAALFSGEHSVDFWDFSELVQEVIVNLVFNLGIGGFKKFKKAIEAFCRHDWNAAADEILDSRAARQTGERYNRLARVLRTQDQSAFEVEGFTSNIL